jgi:hypothetical protein
MGQTFFVAAQALVTTAFSNLAFGGLFKAILIDARLYRLRRTLSSRR